MKHSKAIAHRRSGGPISSGNDQAAAHLLVDVRALIDAARGQVAQVVNAGLVRLYWSVGRRIRQDILKEKRAEYGQRIVATLSRQLTREYGHGFSRAALFRMVQFAETFPKNEIVSTLSGQLAGAISSS